MLKRDDILDDSLLFALADDTVRNNNHMGSIGDEGCDEDENEGNASIAEAQDQNLFEK